MSEPTPADLLREAAHVLRERGWCRGSYRTEDGRHCALGAIYAVPRTSAQQREGAREALADCIANSIGGRHVPTWNDELAIDGEDVAVHMEKAAARWEETAGLTDSSAAGA